MAGRILLGALLAAVAMFIWGFIYWAALPFGEGSMNTVPNEDAVRSALSQNLPDSGVYYFPGMDKNASDKAAAEKSMHDKVQSGPLGLIFYKKDGTEPMAPALLFGGFVHGFIAAILMGILLAMALPALPLYGQRVVFVLVGGIFASYAVLSGFVNWWYMSLGFAFANGIYIVLSWLFAGLVLAWFISEGGPRRVSYGSGGGSGGAKNAYTFMPPVFIRRD